MKNLPDLINDFKAAHLDCLDSGGVCCECQFKKFCMDGWGPNVIAHFLESLPGLDGYKAGDEVMVRLPDTDFKYKGIVISKEPGYDGYYVFWGMTNINTFTPDEMKPTGRHLDIPNVVAQSIAFMEDM